MLTELRYNLYYYTNKYKELYVNFIIDIELLINSKKSIELVEEFLSCLEDYDLELIETELMVNETCIGVCFTLKLNVISLTLYDNYIDYFINLLNNIKSNNLALELLASNDGRLELQINLGEIIKRI